MTTVRFILVLLLELVFIPIRIIDILFGFFKSIYYSIKYGENGFKSYFMGYMTGYTTAMVCEFIILMEWAETGKLDMKKYEEMVEEEL